MSGRSAIGRSTRASHWRPSAPSERRQAERVRGGETLRAQFRFDEYLERRGREPDYTFRRHLRDFGGAIEE